MSHTTASGFTPDVQRYGAIAAAIFAGALWGLVFLVPAMLPGFTPMQLSSGRYLAYGIAAAVLLAPSWRSVSAKLNWRDWRDLALLGLAGNIVYYLFVVNAVQSGGVAMTSLVIGLLPLTVTVIGSRAAHAVPLRRLLPSLLLGGAGLLCISWESLTHSAGSSWLGLLCAIGALTSWTIYAVANSRRFARMKAVTAHEWSLLTGVVTGVEALVLAVPAFGPGSASHTLQECLYFAGVVTALALLCSVLANGLWNHVSRILPLTLLGQMIVFETVFALIYACLVEARWLTLFETAALVLLIAGVISCAAAHRHKQA